MPWSVIFVLLTFDFFVGRKVFNVRFYCRKVYSATIVLPEGNPGLFLDFLRGRAKRKEGQRTGLVFLRYLRFLLFNTEFTIFLFMLPRAN